MILALSSGLSAAGHDAAVMNLRRPSAAGPGLVETAGSLGLESREIECGSRIDFAALSALRGYVGGRRFDLIHSHDYKSDSYAFVCARATRARLVATCHNWASDGLRMRLYKAFDKALMRRFSRIAAVSEPLRRELLLSGVDGARLVMIPNGVTVEDPVPPDRAVTIRASLGIGAGEGVVISVGRLSEEKGHSSLIAAVPEVAAAQPRSRFLIVGGGRLRRELEEEARARRLGGRVMFLGERRDVMDLLAASDVFVLPSRKEGLPLALLEAMACRKPVIAAPLGEIPAVIAHGVSGLLIDPADTGALARGIIRLLAGPAEAAALAEAGFRKVRKDYSAEAMVRRYLELYREALAP